MSESQYGTPLLIQEGKSSQLTKLPIGLGGEYDEAFIQKLAFDFPDCLPITEIDRAYENLIPVCMELSTPVGRLDILYVTPKGHLVIVEAKLWRNPEARRKVMGQLLDYAKELSKWKYEDLQREVSRATSRKGNVLYDLVKKDYPLTDESDFVDEVSKSLRKGRFLLLVLGDGIREGAAGIAEFIEDVGHLEFTFGMVELGLFSTPQNGILIQPRTLVKTVIVKRFVVTTDLPNIDISSDDESDNQTDDEGRSLSDLQLFYLSFWPEWIDGLRLDDPSQPFPKSKRPSLGNMIFPMPPSGGQCWITIFFSQQAREVGVFLTFTRGEFGNLAYESLLKQKDEIELEVEAPLRWDSDGEKHRIICFREFDNLRAEENRAGIKEYLSNAVNNYVNAFRPRLQNLVDQS